MRSSRVSEVFSVQKFVAVSEHDIASIADLVLLSHIAHIEQLLVVEGKKLSGSVHVHGEGNRGHGPPNHFLDHSHAHNASSEASSGSISGRSNLHIVEVFTLSNIHPVLLNSGLVVSDSAVQDVLGEEVHSEVDCHLVVWWDASVIFVKLVEVVLGGGVLLCSIQN